MCEHLLFNTWSLLTYHKPALQLPSTCGFACAGVAEERGGENTRFEFAVGGDAAMVAPVDIPVQDSPDTTPTAAGE